MLEIVREICALQPRYSSSNTPAMRRRGQLIREDLKNAVHSYQELLSASLGEYGSDFGVEAKDGIGRKTEAPWVRFFSKRMSPNPRSGFYCVVHFSADGSAFWITVGCGSTVWSGEDLRPISAAELFKRTEWARGAIKEQFGTLEPLVDEIKLGAKASLPRTFERATVVAKKLSPHTASIEEVESALVAAARMLKAIYDRQSVGGDLTPREVDEAAIVALSRPQVAYRQGQGFALSHEQRRAVELRAMQLAIQWLENEGFEVEDTSAKASFDLLATSPSKTLKVEVKGTTSPEGRDIMMTRNEVELHRAEKGDTALIVVSGIKLCVDDGKTTASSGRLEPWIGWDIDQWQIEPLSFKLSRKETN